jgi:putative ABC transport system permease protein
MPAAHLLTLITWPYARRRGFRCLLIVLSIALGVSLFVGMHLAGLALLEGFQQVVDRVAGSTQLQISAGDNGFPEEVLEKVQSLDSVAVASPVIEAVVESAIPGQGSLLILAVDMTGDQKLRRYDLNERADQAVDDPLVFLAQADSILISRQMADRAGLRIKSRLPLETTQGITTFTVRGIMRPGGLASAYDGALAVIDVYAAQKIFGRGRTFDRIDVGVRDGVPVDACRG